MSDNKKIFTFWEPAENLPVYLKLCIKTWKKFLPDYEIIILDYSKLDKWLGKKYFDNILYEKFSLPKQADAIRCAILKKYGGIWMDADTIITSSKVREILETKSEFTLIGEHICFISAHKEAYVLKRWEKGIKQNLLRYKILSFLQKYNLISIFLPQRKIEKLERWDYLGNSILDHVLRKKYKKYFYSMNKYDIFAFPECNWAIGNNILGTSQNIYQNFYFKNDYSEYVLKYTHGIITLHNSWTPKDIMDMTQEEFLAQHNTLSGILKKVLSK